MIAELAIGILRRLMGFVADGYRRRMGVTLKAAS